MTTASTNIEEIKELIVRSLNLTDLKPADIGDDDHLFVEGLGLDSVDALELVVEIEKHFDLTIEDEAIGKEAFASAAALTAFVNEKLQGRTPDVAHE